MLIASYNGPDYWCDDDAVKDDDGGLVFTMDDGRKFKLWRYGLLSSPAHRWAHYCPDSGMLYSYSVEELRSCITDHGRRASYRPHKPQPPTSRGYKIAIERFPVPVRQTCIGWLLDDKGINALPCGEAGFSAEDHFEQYLAILVQVGDIQSWQKATIHDDRAGIDFLINNTQRLQLKLDRQIAKTGNLWIETHKRAKNAGWLEA